MLNAHVNMHVVGALSVSGDVCVQWPDMERLDHHQQVYQSLLAPCQAGNVTLHLIGQTTNKVRFDMFNDDTKKDSIFFVIYVYKLIKKLIWVLVKIIEIILKYYLHLCHKTVLMNKIMRYMRQG
jgi:hypothetical protein